MAVLCVFLSVLSAWAQSDLTVTLPNGKNVTFQTPEQKDRYVAALARRMAATAAAPPAAPTAPATPAPAAAGSEAAARAAIGSSLEPSANARPGIVNPDAPAFTADYYMGVPESWIGKKVALSVGYITSLTETPDADGYRQFSASTWNHAANTSLGDRSGGQITLFVKAANALKLMQLCGTSFRWGSTGWARTAIIRGEFRRLPAGANKDGSSVYGLVKGYCLYVD